MSKAIVLIVSLIVFSGATWASNARRIALGDPAHYCDVQNVVDVPSDLYCLGDQIQFEFGETPASAATSVDGTPNGEGTLIQSVAGGKLGFVVGRHSDDINGVRQLLNASFFPLAGDKPFLPTENSLSLLYASKAGEMVWGLGLYLSSSDIKSTKQKQTTQVVTLGLDAPVWFFNARLPLNYDATGLSSATGLVELKSKPAMTMTGGYKLTPNQMIFVDVTGGAGKVSVAGTEALDLTIVETTVAFSNVFFKKDGTDAYYQLGYTMVKTTSKTAAGTSEKTDTTLPFLMGIETEATPWMVIRGSVSQSVLIASTKTDSADADTMPHDTKVGAGTGFKWGKSLLDLTLNAATNGKFGSDTNFGGNASYTYAF